MTRALLLARDRKSIELGARIGKGGEGEVYALAGYPDQAVKLYTLKDLQDRAQKVDAMIRSRLTEACKLVAFPIAAVIDRGGAFAGFTMPFVKGHQPLHELYAPGARRAAFPQADYRFLVRAAANVARAVASVHAAGCVIGDINHSGVLVSESATVALIDADSFQLIDGAERYLCRVGVPEYTPPELQGRKLDGVVRTPNHDAFGLAVIVFQLLWMGRHPFSGRYDKGEMPIETAIREFRFVYSRRRKVGMAQPPATPRLEDFPAEIGAAFEAAFDERGERPTAAQWVALLTELERNLRACTRTGLHHYPVQASACPWCRMEEKLGVQLFLPKGQAAAGQAEGPSGAASGTEIASLWRAIDAVVAPAPTPQQPVLKPVTVVPSEEARRAKQTLLFNRILGAGALAAAGALLVYASSFWFLGLGLGIFGVNRLFAASSGNVAAIVQGATEIERQWLLAIEIWREKAASSEFELAKAEMSRAREELEKLPALETWRLNDYQSNRQKEQLKAYLSGFQIRRFKFKGIGPAKLLALTSYGIETAADVSPSRVIAVPGFGPATAQPLLAWRHRLETRFAYNPNATPFDRQRVAQIKAEIATSAVELRHRLAAGPKQLADIAARIEARRLAPDPHLQSLHEKREAVAADLKLLGRPMPAVTLTRTWNSPPSATKPAARQPVTPPGKVQIVRCPRCNGVMVARLARRGTHAGNRFWGCARYPSCRGTRPFP